MSWEEQKAACIAALERTGKAYGRAQIKLEAAQGADEIATLTEERKAAKTASDAARREAAGMGIRNIEKISKAAIKEGKEEMRGELGRG